MKKEEFDKLPETEQRHFNHCPKCNEYYDLRDPKQVQKHVHGVTSGMVIGSLPEVTEL